MNPPPTSVAETAKPARVRQTPPAWSVATLCGLSLFVWITLLFMVAVFSYIKLVQPTDMHDSLLLLLLGACLILARPIGVCGILLGLILLLRRQQPRWLVYTSILGNIGGLTLLALLTTYRFG